MEQLYYYNCISSRWKWFNIEVFDLNWKKFLDFYEKNLCKKEKGCKNRFYKQEKSWTCLKMFQNSTKIWTAWAVLGHSKPTFYSVGQPRWPTFFRGLGPLNYFSAATALT